MCITEQNISGMLSGRNSNPGMDDAHVLVTRYHMSRATTPKSVHTRAESAKQAR